MAFESGLNEAQRRRILSNARHADKLLSEIEAILTSFESKSIFPRYLADVSPPQAKLIRSYAGRFRSQLARGLDTLGIAHEGATLGSLHSIRVTLAFLRVAIQEMAPHYLRGYGPLPEKVMPQLQGLCTELEGLLERLGNALTDGRDTNLESRLERLQQAPGGLDLLRRMDRIIADRGLVEMRPRLAMIVERLESNRFEIAVFGRVSSGKSSLLNHILRTTALPVGVSPITAVPTRLIHGGQALLSVTFADRHVEAQPIERLPEFVSEKYNPANRKGVIRLVVDLPSERLRSGLAFVDTPGLGSLATAGPAETLAYLPQCDLGLVLIGAVSPLNDEDLSTILRLYQAAIPVKVLLSKADLLSPADLESALEYTAGELRAHLGLEIAVHPVSTSASHARLLEEWFAREIAPLYEKHQLLAQESSRRKTAALRETVVAALRAKLDGTGNRPALEREELLALERDLRASAGKLEQARVFCLRASGEIRGLAADALYEAADALLVLWTAAANGIEPGVAVEQAIAKTASSAVQVHTYLQELARALAAALQRTSKALGSHDAPPEMELLEAVQEMPHFDFPPVREDFARPWIRYPKALARKRIHGVLSALLEAPLADAFTTHGRLVENWSREVLAALQSRFDASADPYRAQVARLLSPGPPAAEEHQAILDALACLGEAGASLQS